MIGLHPGCAGSAGCSEIQLSVSLPAARCTRSERGQCVLRHVTVKFSRLQIQPL
jgi:hypothetical protein